MRPQTRQELNAAMVTRTKGLLGIPGLKIERSPLNPSGRDKPG